MMKNKECFLYNQCNHIDCNKDFCMRRYKLDKLYNLGCITESQRKHLDLFIDADSTDLEEFQYLSSVEKNIEEFIAEGKNLYIYSKICGNGKTSWTLRFAQAYLNKIWWKSNLECRVLFINVPRYLLAIKSNISEKSEYVADILSRVFSADLVIWDEIGSKGLTSFEHENVLSLINNRLEFGKSNIYTSNLSYNELHEAVGDRLYSRIVNNSTSVELHGADKRGVTK